MRNLEILRDRSVRFFQVASLIVLVYCGGYGLFRWQHVLVRISYFSQLKRGLLVSEIRHQVDRGESAIQSSKAEIGPTAAIIFRPLCVVEEQYWISMENQDRLQHNNSSERDASSPFLDECNFEE